jgi:OB-fold nucleic acid binding domain
MFPMEFNDSKVSQNDEKEGVTDNILDVKSKLSSLTGAERCLIGLSPHYWAYIPFLIVDIHFLALVRDVFCIISTNGDDSNHDHEGAYALNFIPVSKCKVVGIVVGIERKQSGLIIYTIDDGTGLIDCLFWPQSSHLNLPLLLYDDNMHFNKEPIFLVGDWVRVFSTIRVAAVSGIQETRQDSNGKHWQLHNCVHELHVNTIQHIDGNHKSCRYSANPEYEHWFQCQKWKERYEQRNAKIIYNGTDVLQLLGTDLVKKALSRSDFPSNDDEIGAWRVFGTDCHCNLPYRDELLYCHCQATVEPLDPDFVFRDFILMKLMHMQNKVCSKLEPLQFAYSTLFSDPKLKSIAHSLGTLSDTDVTRLVCRTFGALRKDGILYLSDDDTDRYVLISRTRVFEQYIQQQHRNEPKARSIQCQATCHLPSHFFSANAPYLRLQLVRRTLMKRKEQC